MSQKILLTSFSTWLAHQPSNSSDDLLGEIEKSFTPSDRFTFVRQLPVDTEKASQQVIAKIQQWQPDIIICCGMAEGRTYLSVESTATCGQECLQTPVNLKNLLTDLDRVKVSHNAGKFVCEGLYYSVLHFLHTQKLSSCCIFVHVPILTPANKTTIIEDFCTILQRLENPSTPLCETFSLG